MRNYPSHSIASSPLRDEYKHVLAPLSSPVTSVTIAEDRMGYLFGKIRLLIVLKMVNSSTLRMLLTYHSCLTN